MAISANTVWEVRPTVGNDTNGGGFVTGASGTDFSQQNAKNTVGNNISTTDAVANGTTTITSATATFTAAIVGNLVFFSGGTGSITGQWRQVTGFTNGTTITIDASIAASTGMTMNIGGALAHWVTALSASVTFNTIYIKATGSDVLTSNGVGSSSQTDIKVIGYNASRSDNGQATITTATNGVILFQFSSGAGTKWLLKNLKLTNTAASRADGIKANLASSTQTGLIVQNCTLDGFAIGINQANSGFNAGIAGLEVLNTEIKNCTSHGIDLNGCTTYINGCYIHDNSGNGIFREGTRNQAGDLVIQNTICYKNTLSGLRDALNDQTCNLRVNSSVFATNTLDGIRLDSGGAGIIPIVTNSILWANSGWGINSTVTITSTVIANHNAYGSNTSGDSTGWVTEPDKVTLTTSPFVSIGTDFSLNTTAGGGAACEGAGYPGVLNGAGTGNLDIGAIDTTTGGGGSTTNFIVSPAITRIIVDEDSI